MEVANLAYGMDLFMGIKCGRRIFKEYTTIRPIIHDGVVVQGVPVGIQAMTPVWILESLKNRIQCLPWVDGNGEI